VSRAPVHLATLEPLRVFDSSDDPVLALLEMELCKHAGRRRSRLDSKDEGGDLAKRALGKISYPASAESSVRADLPLRIL